MRTTFRLSLAAVLLIAAAGIARAQDASAAPPPAAPDLVVTPVADLPAIPFAGPAPAAEPALTIDQSAIAVEPVVPAVEVAEPPATEQAKSEVTTTTRHVAKKTVKKPAEKPAAEVSVPAKPAAAAASLSAADTSANPPPPNAAASSKAEPVKSVEPLPPSANPAAVDPVEATKPPTRMGMGSWALAGLVVLALFGIFTLLRRRKTRQPSSIVQLADLSLDPEPVPVPTRP